MDTEVICQCRQKDLHPAFTCYMTVAVKSIHTPACLVNQAWMTTSSS